MPKHAVHAFVLNSVIDRLCDSDKPQGREIGDILRRNHFAAVIGCFGPDLHVWAPERDESTALLRFIYNLKLAADHYDRIAGIIDHSIGNLTRGDTNELSRATGNGSVEEIRAAVGGMVASISPGLLNGIAGGHDFFADASRLQSLIDIFLGGTISGRGTGRRMADYKWSDRLHFWHAGDYARNLLRSSRDESEKAYAYGFMTHIATDLIVHQFVRKSIGGSYNKNPQGHFVCESFLDAWIYDDRYGGTLNGHMVSLLGLEPDMPRSTTRLIIEAMAMTYGHDQGMDYRYPTEDDLIKSYDRIRDHYYLQDGLNLKIPVAPFPEVAEVLKNVFIKYGSSGDHTIEESIMPRDGPIIPDRKECPDYRAELEYRLASLSGDVKRGNDNINTMLELFNKAENSSEAASLLYGIWSEAYDIMSGLLSTIALTGFTIPEPTDLGLEYARRLLFVKDTQDGVRGPEYYIGGRRFDAEKIIGYIDAHHGDGPIIAGDDDELGNAVDMATWMISHSMDPALLKYVFANWAMESEELGLIR